MNLASLLVVPSLIAQAPQKPPSLPTPTPGLSEQGQILNYDALTKGTVVKTAEVDGETYTVRNMETALFLYNSKGHILCIAVSASPDIVFACGAYDGDPLTEEGQKLTFFMDGETYTAKVIKVESVFTVGIYNSKNHILFAMVNIRVGENKEIMVMVPRNGETM
jgi:hypothetical protein